MTSEPFIAHSELTNEIYIVTGKEKYRVTEQAIKAVMAIKALEQEPQTFKWCTDCKEYDQEKHCCHRWSKVIRDTVEEMKQEPFNPMVEIDLYSVIKQKYIEREVLDKIRAEIVELTKCPYGTECLGANCPSNTDCMICGDHVLEIIDKYKAETEAEDTPKNMN